ncbi:hypothetical protein V6Z12_D13G046000 [Gossypium hirsutum]
MIKDHLATDTMKKYRVQVGCPNSAYHGAMIELASNSRASYIPTLLQTGPLLQSESVLLDGSLCYS